MTRRNRVAAEPPTGEVQAAAPSAAPVATRDVTKVDIAKEIDELVKQLDNDTTASAGGGEATTLPTVHQVADWENKLKKAAKVIVTLCDAGNGLPYGIGTVLKGVGAVFKQLAVMVQNAELALLLAIDVALMIEVLQSLSDDGGFDNGNKEFWVSVAGQLHVAVLKQALRQAQAAMGREQARKQQHNHRAGSGAGTAATGAAVGTAAPAGGSPTCKDSKDVAEGEARVRIGEVTTPVCCGLWRFTSRVALASSVHEDLVQATERLDKARRQFCEALITKRVLSDSATDGVEAVYARQTTGRPGRQLRLVPSAAGARPAVFFGAEECDEAQAPAAASGGSAVGPAGAAAQAEDFDALLQAHEQCMGYSEPERGRCTRLPVAVYEVRGCLHFDAGKNWEVIRLGQQENNGQPAVIIRRLYVCSNHHKKGGFLRTHADTSAAVLRLLHPNPEEEEEEEAEAVERLLQNAARRMQAGCSIQKPKGKAARGKEADGVPTGLLKADLQRIVRARIKDYKGKHTVADLEQAVKQLIEKQMAATSQHDVAGTTAAAAPPLASLPDGVTAASTSSPALAGEINRPALR